MRAVSDNCPDCCAAIGEEHADGCDIARCLLEGHQRLGCPSDHNCGHDKWTGLWPGVEDCHRLGLWCLYVNGKFVPCDPDAAGAIEDLNRLGFGTYWNTERLRWEFFPTIEEVRLFVEAARARQLSPGREIASELGLDDETARRLGFYNDEDM